MTVTIPKTAKAIVCDTQGDIDVLHLADVPVVLPGPDEVLMKVEYSGVNYIGIYPQKTPGLVIGNEPSGEIVAIGSNVKHLAVGDKAVSFGNLRGYAEYYLGNANHTAKLPEGVSTKLAASAFLQGITGALCNNIGATVIATTSTEEKAAVARKAGAHHVVLYGNKSMDDVVKEVKALTPGGEGVHAVFDGVGKDTFESNFEVVRRKGTLVILGAASGPVPPFPPLKLMPKSQKLIRPGCGAYLATLPEFLDYANKLFDVVSSGALKIALWKEDGYPFTTEGVQQAHRDLSGRGTTGKLLLHVQ
ncbi:NADPH2:quinone reductase [Pseudohyphozyma bogoriensis]|nr:NADPH2:quinone reductase [Pseudohyphozyma bogoriensis]